MTTYEKVIKADKKHTLSFAVCLIIFLLLSSSLLMLSCRSNDKAYIVIALLVMAFPFFMIVYAVKKYLNIDSEFDKIRDALGFYDNTAFNEYLETMKQVNVYFFINEDLVINFCNKKFYNTSDIYNVEKTRRHSKNHNTYYVKITLNNGLGTDSVDYSNSDKQSNLYNELKIALRKYEHKRLQNVYPSEGNSTSLYMDEI